MIALGKFFDETYPMTVRESSPLYCNKIQGEYTLEDYLALPDDRRVELIDGVFYDMSAPTSIHQLIGGQIYTQLNNYLGQKKRPCLPFIAPVDVQLDCDEKTIVQPDVMIVCDREKVTKARIFGAPDFVIEVLSNSTKKKDRLIKHQKYKMAGVREYWMIDPDKRNVVVHDFERDKSPVIYGFDAKVPVGIYGGECEIDMKEAYEVVRFIYERRIIKNENTYIRNRKIAFKAYDCQ